MNNDIQLLEEKYEQIIIEADLGRVFGNLAVDIIRYFRCKQGKSVGGQCPDAKQLVLKLAQWAKLNQDKLAAKIINNAVTPQSTPEQTLVNIYHAIKEIHD